MSTYSVTAPPSAGVTVDPDTRTVNGKMVVELTGRLPQDENRAYLSCEVRVVSQVTGLSETFNVGAEAFNQLWAACIAEGNVKSTVENHANRHMSIYFKLPPGVELRTAI